MKNKQYKIGLGFLLAIMVGMTIYLMSQCEPGKIREAMENASLAPLFSGVGMVFVHLLLGALGVYLILHSLGQPVNLRRGLKYSCIEMYYSAITPSATGGQPAQLYYMSKDGITTAAGTLSILIITVIYKIVLLLLSLLAAVFESSFVFGNSPLITVLFILGIIINVLVVVFCLMLMYSKYLLQRIVQSVIAFLVKHRLMRHPERKLDRFDKMYREYRVGATYFKEHIMVSVKLLIIVLVQRIALFSVAYCVYQAFGGGEFSWFDFMTIQIVIATAVDSMPFPGGAGLAETLYTLIYRKVFSAGMILPAMLLTRGISFYLYFVIYAIVSLYAHARLFIREKREIQNG